MENGQLGFILYACAGCSKGGQAAYKVAISLDERNAAEMSCLAGIASGRQSFFRKLKNKKIAAIDGCPTACAKSVLTNQGLKVDKHFQLHDFGIKKNVESTNDQIESVVKQIADKLR